MTSVPLSFVGAVNIAVRIVTEAYPKAQLLEALATAPDDQYMDSPSEFSRLKVLFNPGDGGTVIIESTAWGEFNPPSYIGPPPIPDDISIQWPIRMDAPEADRLLKQADYTAPYNNMLLRHPFHPGLEEPYYIFHLKKENFIFVGTKSHKVFRPDQVAPEEVESSLKRLRALGE